MIGFLLSPIPFILAFFLYMASDFFNRGSWKKVLRICSIIVLTVTILTWINSLNAKIADSAIHTHAMLVGTVTHHVEQLLNDHKYQDAGAFIKEFNTYYYETFYNSDKLKQFLENKQIKLYSPDLEVIQKKLDQLNQEMRSEPSPSL